MACSPAVMRRLPAGRSRVSRSAVSARSISSRCGPEALYQSLTRLGRYHAAGGAGQQPHIETRFEMAHGMAERRL